MKWRIGRSKWNSYLHRINTKISIYACGRRPDYGYIVKEYCTIYSEIGDFWFLFRLLPGMAKSIQMEINKTKIQLLRLIVAFLYHFFFHSIFLFSWNFPLHVTCIYNVELKSCSFSIFGFDHFSCTLHKHFSLTKVMDSVLHELLFEENIMLNEKQIHLLRVDFLLDIIKEEPM